jgi:protein-S-isoprenylcysteine O-methyltransferase Ste14
VTKTIFKTILFTVIVPGAVTVYIPLFLFGPARSSLPFALGPFRYIGIAFILLGILIYLWCAWDFVSGRGTPAPIDPPKELVVRGLYRFVRNPMYVGVLSILIGEAFFFESATLFWYGAAVFLLFNLFVIFYEEPALGRQFGKSYEDYLATVGRWLPRRIKSRGRQSPASDPQ